MASTAIRRSSHTAHRVLIAEMDSIAQRARYDAKDHHVATTELSGMLRIGRLVSEHILLTDVMVLDGCYFMRLGPEGVIRELGATEAQFPLTITGHYPSLGEGLSARLANADFAWSLDNVHRGREVPTSVTNTWQQWLDYVERGIVRYEQQTGQFALPAGAAYPLEHEGAEALQAALEQTLGRGAAFTTINGALEGEPERERIRDWWNVRYLDGISRVTGADWLSFEPADEPSRRMGENEQIRLPERLRTWAESNGSATISLAWDHTVKQRAALHRKPSQTALRALTFSAMQVSQAPTRTGVLTDATLKIFIALAVITAEIIGLQITDALPFLSASALTILVLSTFPFGSLSTLLSNLKPDRHSLLLLSRNKADH